MSKVKNAEYKCKNVEYKCIDGVVHVIYGTIIPTYVEEIADMYEGKIDNRIGINFPMSIVTKYKGKGVDNIKNFKEGKYVVVYKKGDKLTKEHELMHAKYYMDDEYKRRVNDMWCSMRESSKVKIIEMLKKMGYPEDKEEILIDEFQAYYYTEKKNFFGKNL